jgi:amino acid permease
MTTYEKKMDDVSAEADIDSGEVQPVADSTPHLARKLGGKEVQLFAIGGAIGTSAYTYFTAPILADYLRAQVCS